MVRRLLNVASSCAVITCMFLTSVKTQDSQSRQGAATPSFQNDSSGFQNAAFPPSQSAYSDTGRDSDPPKDTVGSQSESDPPPQADDTGVGPDAAPSNDVNPPGGDAAAQQSQGFPSQPGAGLMRMESSAAGAGSNPLGVADATSASAGAAGVAAESALQKLTEFRPRHRKTVDGRLCAAAFVHEGQTYTDCTDARSPDGTTGREWCYVEVQLLGKGPKDWEFCSPPLNYNALRAFAKKEFGALMATNEEMIESLDVEERRLQDMLSRFQHTCGAAHAALKETLGQTESRLSRGTKCLERLQAALKEVGLIESAIEDVRTTIEREGAKSLQDPENCLVKPGYEADPIPDGLRAAYFANDRFTWPPAKYRTDRKIDFLFFADGPIEGVPSHAYSIRWDGFILAPHSGTYIFTTETDCGVRVFLNTRPIIVDRMPAATEADAFGFKSIHLVATEERSGVHRKDSPKTELISGEKYRIRVELVHSNHLKYKNSDTGVFRLMWRSGAAEPTVIPETIFFTSNAAPTAKFSGLDSRVFDSAFLRDGVQPFVDDKSHYLVDIPLRYHGRRMLRSLSQPNIDSFAVELNVPAILYVASYADEPLPLEPTKDASWTVHDSHESMTLLSGVDASGRALEAKRLSIKFISLRSAGGTHFKVAHTAIPFIIFVEPRKDEAFSCDAEEEVVSLVGGPVLAECEASSEKPGGFDCNSGLNGKHMDRRFGTWKTKGAGVGQSITVRFRHLVQLSHCQEPLRTHFRFKPLDDQLLWPSQITLSYSEEGDEEAETFSMRHSNSLEHNTYKLRAPLITQYVKAEISQMYVNGMESGGSFEFLGSACTTKARAQSISSLRKILIESCDQSLEAIPEVVPLEEGFQFIAVCPHHCVVSPEGRVYGVSPFAPGSTVCTSGIFAGICKAAFESECSLLVTVGGRKTTFKRNTANDIEALEHGPSDASFTLTKAPCDSLEDEKPSLYFTFGSQSAPEGWLVDDGSMRRMRNGIEYGWLRPALVSSVADVKDPITESGVVFPSPSNHTCQLGEDCTPNFWSAVVAHNGIYQVEALLALPFESQYGNAPIYLQINGVSIAHGAVVPKGRVFGGAATVEVTEKLIDVASICKDAACGVEPTMLLSLSISYVGPLPGHNYEKEEE